MGMMNVTGIVGLHSIYVLVEEQAVTEDRQDIHVEDGQTDQRQYCLSVGSSSDRTPDQSIRNAETSVASDFTVMHTTIPQSDIRSECVFSIMIMVPSKPSFVSM